MKNDIKELAQSLISVSAGYLTGIEKNNIKRIRELIPQIQQFATWFLEGNRFGIEEEEYQELSRGLLMALEDIVEALEQGDRVLLHDAVSYGFLEYLKLFLEQEEKPDDSL